MKWITCIVLWLLENGYHIFKFSKNKIFRTSQTSKTQAEIVRTNFIRTLKNSQKFAPTKLSRLWALLGQGYWSCSVVLVSTMGLGTRWEIRKCSQNNVLLTAPAIWLDQSYLAPNTCKMSTGAVIQVHLCKHLWRGAWHLHSQQRQNHFSPWVALKKSHFLESLMTAVKVQNDGKKELLIEWQAEPMSSNCWENQNCWHFGGNDQPGATWRQFMFGGVQYSDDFQKHKRQSFPYPLAHWRHRDLWLL